MWTPEPFGVISCTIPGLSLSSPLSCLCRFQPLTRRSSSSSSSRRIVPIPYRHCSPWKPIPAHGKLVGCDNVRFILLLILHLGAACDWEFYREFRRLLLSETSLQPFIDLVDAPMDSPEHQQTPGKPHPRLLLRELAVQAPAPTIRAAGGWGKDSHRKERWPRTGHITTASPPARSLVQLCAAFQTLRFYTIIHS